MKKYSKEYSEYEKYLRNIFLKNHLNIYTNVLLAIILSTNLVNKQYLLEIDTKNH